jgi:hypothetical protein
MCLCLCELRRELFKRDRRKLPFLTDLCFAPTPVVLQNNKKTTPKVLLVTLFTLRLL